MHTAPNYFDPQYLHHELVQILLLADSGFKKEHEQYLRTVERLTNVSNAVTDFPVFDYLESIQSQFDAKLLYVVWHGLSWNLDCYRNPVNKLHLGEDFEKLHGEQSFYILPYIQEQSHKILSFVQQLPGAYQEDTEKIASYFTYLETYGFEIMHYWGFQQGNIFFPKVIPGYVADTVFTFQYLHMIEDDLGMQLSVFK